jgi:hypothetical protein
MRYIIFLMIIFSIQVYSKDSTVAQDMEKMEKEYDQKIQTLKMSFTKEKSGEVSLPNEVYVQKLNELNLDLSLKYSALIEKK